MASDITSALDDLARAIRICTRCPLHKSRRHAVPGEGDAVLPIMFVGEAPGADEDRLAKPFVGAAGKRLNELLASVGIDRHDVRVENCCRCRPPVVDHRQTAPTTDQIATCRPYLDRAVGLLQPRIIVPLGATALSVFLPLRSQRSPKAAITIHECHGLAYWQDDRWVFPMYHPAWELRNGGNARHPGQLRAAASARETMERDIRRLRYLLDVDTATRAKPWTAETLHLISEPHTPPAHQTNHHAPVPPMAAQTPAPGSTAESATHPEFPGFLETYDRQWITHHDFLGLVGRAAAGEGVGGDDPARAWLATLGYPTALEGLTRAQVSAALDAAEHALAAQRAAATQGMRMPTVHRRAGTVTTVTWHTDRLHPMLRTASAIDELMRRATGLTLTRMNDTATTGAITAIARDDRSTREGEPPHAEGAAP
jgi:uracil-DNA glycosylase family 4